MNMNIYTIYDEKAKAYLLPFFMQNDAMAKRVFAECANDPTHMFCKHSSDYFLHRIGTYDDQTATIDSTVSTNLMCANQLMFATSTITEEDL